MPLKVRLRMLTVINAAKLHIVKSDRKRASPPADLISAELQRVPQQSGSETSAHTHLGEAPARQYTVCPTNSASLNCDGQYRSLGMHCKHKVTGLRVTKSRNLVPLTPYKLECSTVRTVLGQHCWQIFKFASRDSADPKGMCHGGTDQASSHQALQPYRE